MIWNEHMKKQLMVKSSQLLQFNEDEFVEFQEIITKDVKIMIYPDEVSKEGKN